MKTEGKPIFQLGLCGDWVEIRKTTPTPKHEGEFSLVFRRKRKRDCLPLFGKTPYYNRFFKRPSLGNFYLA